MELMTEPLKRQKSASDVRVSAIRWYSSQVEAEIHWHIAWC